MPNTIQSACQQYLNNPALQIRCSDFKCVKNDLHLNRHYHLYQKIRQVVAPDQNLSRKDLKTIKEAIVQIHASSTRPKVKNCWQKVVEAWKNFLIFLGILVKKEKVENSFQALNSLLQTRIEKAKWDPLLASSDLPALIATDVKARKSKEFAPFKEFEGTAESMDLEYGKAAVATIAGKTNEDRFLTQTHETEDKKADVLAVFDGHGDRGDLSSSWLRGNVLANLKLSFKFKTLKEDLKVRFKEIADGLSQTNKDNDRCCGSTCNINIVLGNLLACLSVGDSRSILFDGKQLTSLSVDHKPKRRISGLNIERSLGDNIEGIKSDPDIHFVDLKNYDQPYLVAASDGLWDVATSDEVRAAVMKMANEGLPCEEIAKRLAGMAKTSGSNDDITVVVYKFTKNK